MENSKKIPLPLLVVAALLPTIFTYLAFSIPGYEKVIYSISKIVIIVLPIVLWHRVCKSLTEFKKRIGWKKTNGIYGVTTGVATAILIIACYYILFTSLDASLLYNKLKELNLIAYFWIMAVFISLWNSFIEEYYWRAFILNEQSTYSDKKLLVCVINGVLFGLHHFIILNVYFDVLLALLFTAGASVGGFLWAWLRLRGVSIIDCYISHVFADLAIMWIGWDMISRFS
ncbi:CPBP family intramembrane glutamic endopeptidase [Candidatus Uabimicrobium amorphum]|uniref:CAAX amino protease n=1 Tax=Uabimicrobium amorphum TaxID=2596890 RepID=A0A5S9IIA0_UABAM|nr:CPBP family intramembrane glutamic endopeptidase [Candidatus Uabimicrobium amorphum]BBM82164.1 CAAX amino protease [Candidatus Uabimicrobium amorphum]